MKKIILFDIDSTLFDPHVFLDAFYSKILGTFEIHPNSKDKLQLIYDQIRDQNGYFIPKLYLEEIVKEFPKIPLEKLNEIFWNIDLFDKSMYKDTSVIRDLATLCVIGIFSKGEKNFQTHKISFIKDILDEKNIYIFSDKISKISEVLENYKDYEVFIVDDDLSVLENVENINPEVKSILIDRNNIYEDNVDITRIQSLNELKEIV